MKVWLTKTANQKLWPAGDNALELLYNVPVGTELEWSVNLKQNHQLHKKIMGFFGFCTKYYFGDSEAHKDKVKFNYVRKDLTVIAGFYDTIVDPRTGEIKLVAKSLEYAKMPPEDRSLFYKKITQAACDHVFNNYRNDDHVMNKLMNWF